MKTLICVVTGIIILSSVKFEQCFSQEIPDGPYLGQKPPGMNPEVFASGIISLPGRRETKIVFSPDGKECFIGILLDRKPTFLYTKQQNGHWLLPYTADFLGEGSTGEPFFSPDGQRFFFIRNADIWMSTRDNQSWAEPTKLASPISTNAEEWHPSVTSDGTLYFCTSRNRPYDIYRSRLNNGKYTEVEKLDNIINSQYGAWDPFIAPDESYIIFSSVKPDGYGKVDQHISYYNQKDNSWTEPQNLGPVINTNGIEYGSYISYDNKYFFFSRLEGWGADTEADIYWVKTNAIFSDSLMGIDNNKEIPKRFNLYQNYPNPFNPVTTIKCKLAKSDNISLKIYNLSGQELEALASGFQTAGEHEINWYPKELPSGIYFCRLQAGEFSETKKLILQR